VISDGDGKVRLQTEILAYAGQQLIPDPVWNADSFASQYHNAGSGISNSDGLESILEY